MGTQTIHFCDCCQKEFPNGGQLRRSNIKMVFGSLDPKEFSGDVCNNCMDDITEHLRVWFNGKPLIAVVPESERKPTP